TARELQRHPFVRKAKKTSYLTELIERYRRYVATHKGEDEESFDGGEDLAEPQPVNEDMWDFGTVRLVGDSGRVVHRPGLNAMDDSATNARAARSTDHDDYGERPRDHSPTKARDFGLGASVADTLKAANPASRQNSPQRKPLQPGPAPSPSK